MIKLIVTSLILTSVVFADYFESKKMKDFRKNKPAKLMHMKEINNCTLCHSDRDPNQLNMLDGKLITVTNSTQLCGQCHGIKLSEWKNGLHGKNSGTWQNQGAMALQRKKLQCVACHEPHAPKFAEQDAVATPKHPHFLVPKNHLPIEKSHHEQ